MDLNGLSLLVDIIDSGNLSRAARKLGMSRANISKRLNHFEKSLGVELLKRSTRQLEATALGRQLYAHGKKIRHELMAAEESLQSLGKDLGGTVRLSVPIGYGQHTMATWLMEFMRLYPQVTLEVIFDNAIEDLIKGAVDFSIRVMGDVPSNLVAHNLGAVEYVACAAPDLLKGQDAVRTLSQLRRLPLITSVLTGEKLKLAGQSESIRTRLMSANFFFLRDAVLQGLGAGLVPVYMVASEISSGQLYQLPIPQRDLDFLRSNLYLLHLPSRYQTKTQKTLIEFLCRKAQAVAAVQKASPARGKNARALIGKPHGKKPVAPS